MAAETPLETLTVAGTGLEANLLQQMLRAEGIESFIEGANTADNFGGNALVSAKIKIAPLDLPRARLILEQLRDQAGTPWYCTVCEETNEGSFDLCWKCGGLREECEGPPPELVRGHGRAENFDAAALEVPAEELAQHHDGRPYAPPLSTDSNLPPDNSGFVTPLSATADNATENAKQIEYAYRLSILGLVTVPIALHVWSMILVLKSFGSNQPLTDSSRNRRNIALAINCLALAFGAALVWYLRPR